MLVIWLSGLLAAIGHSFLWASFVNQVHARGWPKSIIKWLSWPAILVVMPLGCLQWLYRCWYSESLDQLWNSNQGNYLYDVLCLGLGVWAVSRWLYRRFVGDPWHWPTQQITSVMHVERALKTQLSAGKYAQVLRLWPWNCSWSLEMLEQQTPLPRLPSTWPGLRIAHLSDWHFTGHVTRPYFDHLVKQVNDWQPDLICLTGDLIDRAECLTWIEPVFGALQAKYGKFYTLGNHDPRMGDLPALHTALAAAGCQDAGGPWQIIDVAGHPLLIAGNEMPWLGPAVELSSIPAEHAGQPLFRLLLSHSPDLFDEAVACDFDLQLSGHVHGGQVQLPVIGPIFAPSRHGIRLHEGTFCRGNTVLHVTRGISSASPLRWNALPQISLLTLIPCPATKTLA